jgi:DUF971 family protein
MVAEVPKPLSVELDRQRGLRIRWSDGRLCDYPLPLLRKACPCAGCREERQNVSPTGLPVLATPTVQREMVTAAGLELVGHYAVRLMWNDGHNAGIYDYELLHALCPAGGHESEA